MKKIYNRPYAQIKHSEENSYKSAQTELKVSDDMILREVAGDYILIPVGEMVIKVHGMISLTESGVLLWKKLQKGCTEEELVEAILAEYEVDRQMAYSDVIAFLEKLRNVGVLISNGDTL